MIEAAVSPDARSTGTYSPRRDEAIDDQRPMSSISDFMREAGGGMNKGSPSPAPSTCSNVSLAPRSRARLAAVRSAAFAPSEASMQQTTDLRDAIAGSLGQVFAIGDLHPPCRGRADAELPQPGRLESPGRRSDQQDGSAALRNQLLRYRPDDEASDAAASVRADTDDVGTGSFSRLADRPRHTQSVEDLDVHLDPASGWILRDEGGEARGETSQDEEDDD